MNKTESNGEPIIKRQTRPVAVVTGGSMGIGLQITHVLVKHGFHVLIASRDSDAVAAAVAPVEHATGFSPCDVRDADSVAELFKFVDTEFGRLDVLVTCAGIGRGESAARLLPGTVANLSEKEWCEVVDTNLKGVFLCVREAARRMVASRNGQILNISSARGVIRGHAFGAAYCASKVAARALLEAVAEELAEFGIRVMSLMPDAVDTRLISGTKLGHAGTITPKQVARMVADMLSFPNDATVVHPFLVPYSTVDKISKLGTAR